MYWLRQHGVSEEALCRGEVASSKRVVATLKLKVLTLGRCGDGAGTTL